MYKRKLVLFPFTETAIEALDCIDKEKYDIMGFIDDDDSKKSDEHYIFSRAILVEYKEVYMLAMPPSRDRAAIIKSLELPETRFINAVHYNASIGDKVTLGYNSLIMAGVVLIRNVIIHNHVCIYPNAVVHHGVEVNDFTMIGSNVAIAENSTIGENCFIGHGSNISNGIRIGSNTVVAMGSNIFSDSSENVRKGMIAQIT